VLWIASQAIRPAGPEVKAVATHTEWKEGHMRLRLAVLAAVLTAVGTVAFPSLVTAAPRHDYNLTVIATPNPVIAGGDVLIYGRLQGSDNANQPIMLYHHLAGSVRGYSLVTSTTTDSEGYYDFPRAEGVVYTNRSWFVRGPAGAHSRTLYERVSPLVDINASTTNTDTDHPIAFTGSVTPNHAHELIYLQQQIGSSDDWRTVARTTLDGGSRYSIAHRWARPGVHDVRVLFRRDARNIAGVSDPVTVEIQQAQVPGFTVNSSSPIAPAGSTVTISGVLDRPGTTTPESGATVQLWGRRTGQGHLVVLGNATTAANGSYSFTQSQLAYDMLYQVRTLPAPHTRARRTAMLHQGVEDVLTMQASSTSTTVGQTVTFSGLVMPDKAGRVIYLQKIGRDGDWHTAEVHLVRYNSSYQLAWRFGAPGTFTFRTRMTSDEMNVGGESPPVTVKVSLPPASSLPQGS
jgi:hypothetical protein